MMRRSWSGCRVVVLLEGWECRNLSTCLNGLDWSWNGSLIRPLVFCRFETSCSNVGHRQPGLLYSLPCTGSTWPHPWTVVIIRSTIYLYDVASPHLLSVYTPYLTIPTFTSVVGQVTIPEHILLSSMYISIIYVVLFIRVLTGRGEVFGSLLWSGGEIWGVFGWLGSLDVMLYSAFRFSGFGFFHDRSYWVPKHPRMPFFFFWCTTLMKIRTELFIVLCTLTVVELQIHWLFFLPGGHLNDSSQTSCFGLYLLLRRWNWNPKLTLATGGRCFSGQGALECR